MKFTRKIFTNSWNGIVNALRKLLALEKSKGKTPRKFSLVTIVDNETGEEMRGTIVVYTPETIILQKVTIFPEGSKKKEVSQIIFDAKKVHFKEEQK